MNVQMITTPKLKCGVHQYTRYLSHSLMYEKVSVRVSPCDRPKESIKDTQKGTSLVHVQFQEYYYRPHMDVFDTDLPVVVTFHDQCIPTDFPWDRVTHSICHTAEIARKVPFEHEILPMGVPTQLFQVLSFGLGRTDQSLVRRVCDRLGMSYTYLNGDPWLSRDDLRAAIRRVDVVVLWYPESAGTGSSFAARIAMGARRPLITNEVSWFKDLEDHPPYLNRVPDELGLEICLEGLRVNSHWELFAPGLFPSMSTLAAAHKALYTKIVATD